MAEIKMTLSEYIKEIGEQNLADLIGVSRTTTKSWRYFVRTPKVKQAKKLINISNGLLDWESIYGDTHNMEVDRAIRATENQDAS
jgi:hypothetical protein